MASWSQKHSTLALHAANSSSVPSTAMGETPVYEMEVSPEQAMWVDDPNP